MKWNGRFFLKTSWWRLGTEPMITKSHGKHAECCATSETERQLGETWKRETLSSKLNSNEGFTNGLIGKICCCRNIWKMRKHLASKKPELKNYQFGQIIKFKSNLINWSVFNVALKCRTLIWNFVFPQFLEITFGLGVMFDHLLRWDKFIEGFESRIFGSRSEFFPLRSWFYLNQIIASILGHSDIYTRRH